MPADIQQRAYLAILSTNHEQRFPAETRREEVPRRTHLAVVPHAMPVAQDQPSYLALEDLPVAIELAAERVTRALSGDRLRAVMRAR